MSQNSQTITLSSFLLGEVEAALNDSSYEITWYLDLQEETVTFISEMYAFDEQQEISEEIEKDEEGRFIEIPGQTSREAWQQMEQFILSLDDQDENTRNQLMNAIQGKGAFGRFKDMVYDMELRDRWLEFKNRQDRKKALEWLQSQDLITGKQVEEGLQMLEERIKKNKAREKEIAKMTKGKRVTCIRTDGHEEKITPGNEYDILDEQRQHLNIRITDDRGKECWLPKSHFKLMD